MSTHDYELYEQEPALSGLERDLFESISADEPWALVEAFSELVRESGSEDERRAAEYITDRLSALDVPHERYDPELWLSHPRDASLAVESPTSESFEAVKTVAFSGNGTVTAEMVQVGSPDTSEAGGILAARLDDVPEDVEGKVALVEADYLSREMILTLEDAGAAAIVGVQASPDEPHEGIATPVWGGVPHPDRQDRVPSVLVVNVSRTVGDRLVELAEEADGDDDPFEATVSATAPRDWYDCPLVLARIPGEADPEDDDFVLLHGHFDSWHYGVTDNATGDAGLLELARVFNDHRDQLKRDLWVAWWPAHSTGRYAGSTWFVDEFALELEDRCVAHVNMDSPGVADATEFVEGVQWMPEANELCQSAITDTCGKESKEHRVARAGDYSFNNLGITGMFMGSSSIPMELRHERGWHIIGGGGGHAEAWHLTTDTIDKADPEVLVRDTRMYATVVARLASSETLPLDHRHTLEVLDDHLTEYEETAGDDFDLAPVRDELDALAGAVDEFYAGVESGAVATDAANETVKRLSRGLVRLDHAERGAFEQDPATGRAPLTRLAGVADLSELEGDEYRFQRTHLKRARNAVVHDLQTLRGDVRATLEE